MKCLTQGLQAGNQGWSGGFSIAEREPTTSEIKMNVAGTERAESGFRKERSTAKRIEIESEPGVAFDVAIVGRARIGRSPGSLRRLFGLRRQSEAATALWNSSDGIMRLQRLMLIAS